MSTSSKTEKILGTDVNAFYDSSALLSAVRGEKHFVAVREVLLQSTKHYGAAILRVEAESGLARWQRENQNDQASVDNALALNTLLSRFYICMFSTEIESVAITLLNRYPLRAADAIHLASWKVLQDALQEPLVFVCLDHRLREAANQEGGIVEPTAI